MLSLKEKNKKEEAKEKELEKLLFNIQYERMGFSAYENSPKYPGLLLKDNDVDDRMSRAVSWLLKKIGSNILKGQSIMNISLPVFIFDQRSMLQVFAYELRLAPYYLQRAFYSWDPLEKMKWVTTFALTVLHISTMQSKPFNPIIGETYQAKIGNLNIYLEQTLNKPPTANFFCFDDNKEYKYYGYLGTVASTGTNSIKAIKIGFITLEFKDGLKYKINLPMVWVRGTTVGVKLYNYKYDLAITNEKHNYCSIVHFNPDEKGFLIKWFAWQKSTPDTFIGEILSNKDVTINNTFPQHTKSKTADAALCSIQGQWLSEVCFNNKRYWSNGDYDLIPMSKMPFTLQSDSSDRIDLLAFSAGDEDKAQENKETLEVLQRHDRKLRADYLEKIKASK